MGAKGKQLGLCFAASRKLCVCPPPPRGGQMFPQFHKEHAGIFLTGLSRWGLQTAGPVLPPHPGSPQAPRPGRSRSFCPGGQVLAQSLGLVHLLQAQCCLISHEGDTLVLETVRMLPPK